MPAETTTLAIPVTVTDVAARTTRTVEVAVDSAVADPLPQDDRASVSFDVVPAPPAGPDPTPTPQPGGGAPPGGAAARSRHAGREGTRAAAQAGPRPAADEQVRRQRRGRLRAGGVRGVGFGHGRDRGRTWRLKGAKANLAANRSVRLRLGSTKALRRAARAAQRRSPKRKLTVVVTVRVRAADGKVATQKVRVPVRMLGR